MARAKSSPAKPNLVSNEGLLPSAKLFARQALQSLGDLGETIDPNRAVFNLEHLAQAEEMLRAALADVRRLKTLAVFGL